jgi:hypothetical protein
MTPSRRLHAARHPEPRRRSLTQHRRPTIWLAALAAGALALAAAARAQSEGGSAAARVAVDGAVVGGGAAVGGEAAPGGAAGMRAFTGIAAVLRYPRCLNCHTTTAFPRQGDDRHPHVNLVRRGPDDRGVPGQRCGTCHQAENNPASGVPGKPDWHLAPLAMGWEGLSDAQLCRVLKDPRRNGGRDLRALAEHLERDPLVAYGWDPGAGRQPVPIPREELVRLMAAWAGAGAPCPSAGTAAE